MLHNNPNSRIYLTYRRAEAQLADAVKVIDAAGIDREEINTLAIGAHFELDLHTLAAMIERRGIEYVRDFHARADELDRLDDDDPSAWLELYEQLEAELQPFKARETGGMRYFATCVHCGAAVVADTSQDTAGRVIGFACLDCGTAFYDRAPGRAQGIRARTDRLQEAILQILVSDELPMSIRHIYYQLEGRGIVTKTDKGYNATLYQLGIMRASGQVPYTWLADNTRWHIRPRTYSNLEAALVNTAETYRRALWETQPAYVEIWCEKDAIASIIGSVTRPYDVPLFVARGFSSKTPLYNIAEDIKAIGKPAYIYQFGDFDPSGVKAFEAASRTLKEFVAKFGGRVELERVAVTDEQIGKWNLPTRPTKESTHSAGWGDRGSVELDVMPPSQLREIARACIERHIDQGELQRIKQIELEEQSALNTILDNFRLARNSEAQPA